MASYMTTAESGACRNGEEPAVLLGCQWTPEVEPSVWRERWEVMKDVVNEFSSEFSESKYRPIVMKLTRLDVIPYNEIDVPLPRFLLQFQCLSACQQLPDRHEVN